MVNCARVQTRKPIVSCAPLNSDEPAHFEEEILAHYKQISRYITDRDDRRNIPACRSVDKFAASSALSSSTIEDIDFPIGLIAFVNSKSFGRELIIVCPASSTYSPVEISTARWDAAAIALNSFRALRFESGAIPR